MSSSFMSAIKYGSLVMTVVAIAALSYFHMFATTVTPIPSVAYLVLLAAGVTGVLVSFLWERSLTGEGSPG